MTCAQSKSAGLAADDEAETTGRGAALPCRAEGGFAAPVFLVACLLAVLSGCSTHGVNQKPMKVSRFLTPLPADPVLTGNMVPVHDPSLIRREDGTYVVFGTDIPFLESEHFIEERCSRDLLEWRGCGYAFDKMPAWVAGFDRSVRGLWAPDISFFHGKYHLYYAASRLGSQRSAIGLATNVTLDPRDAHYRWTDEGVVLASHAGDDFNAIDASIFVERDKAGREAHIWLNYGSFWRGLFQQEVDGHTGHLLPGGPRYHLAEQPVSHQGAIEGATMASHNGWYYLAASVGICCAIPIEKDTYQQILGRARSVHGPFVAEDGGALLRGAGTVVLRGDAHWVGPGGGSFWQSPDRAETLLTFHALHRRENGALDLWLEKVTWKDDWPVLRSLP